MSGAVHTAGRKYPCEWFRASRYGDLIEERTFQRETEHMLFTGSRGFRKVTDHDEWCPTREEAAIRLQAFRAARDAERLARSIRATAPELLEALEQMLEAHNTDAPECVFARAIVAKARGERA